MKTSEIGRALSRRWPATLVVVVVAIALAVVMHGQLSSVPTGQATSQILVDSQSSTLLNVNTNAVGLTAQASVLAQALTSEAVLQEIAKSAHVPAGSLSAQGPFNGAGEGLDVPTPSEARSVQVVAAGAAYHIAFVAQQNVPIITVTVKGPDPQGAGRVADAVLPGAQAWLATIAASSTLPKSHQLVLRQLGDAQSGPVNSKAALEVAAVLAVAVIILGLLGVVLLDRRLGVRRELRLRHRTELGELEQALEGDRAATAVADRDGADRDGADRDTSDDDRDVATATRGRADELAGALATFAPKSERNGRPAPKKNGTRR